MGTLSAARISSVIPSGFIKCWPTTSLPSGWLLCNGAVVAQADYPFLFAAIGTTYDTGGEGAGNFRLPDLRGRFLRGLDNGRGVDTGRALGSAQASQQGRHRHASGPLTISAPSGTAPHSHSTSAPASNAPHDHAQNVSANPGTGSRTGEDYDVSPGPNQPFDQAADTSSTSTPHSHPSMTLPSASTNAGTHSHPISGSVAAAGGTGNGSETRPRNVALSHMIKI